MGLRRLVHAATIGALLVMLAGTIGAHADESQGRPVVNQAEKDREAAEEAEAAAREAEANKVKAAADAEQAHAIYEESKEQAAERAALLTPGAGGGSALVDQLSERLGVSRTQAAGGAGAIFSTAKQKLGDDDFGKIAAAVPGTDALLAQAPGGDAGSAASGSFGGVASLTGPFAQLGMSSDMAGKFLPIVLEYVQSKGGDSSMNLLAKAFK